MPPPIKPAGKIVNALDVYRNEAFDIGYMDYFKDIKNNKISQVLNNTERNVKLSTVTYRQLNSWEEQGLLSNEREGRGWRRFSIMDALWTKIIQELREFGLSWEKLKATKESLSFQSDLCGVPMPMLEFYTAFAIGNKMPVLLLVFRDGVAVPVNFTQYKVTQQVLGVENHLQLNLNEMLQGLFPNMDLKPNYKSELPVSVNEMELLAYLGLGTFEKITVVFNGKQMESFEGVQRVKAKKRIHEIMREHSYQNINIQEEDGEITAIFQTIKKKFSKGSNPT
jgi:DNA-binding transcriptional MerR regulator